MAPFLIVNPNSGDGGPEELLAEAAARGIQTHVLVMSSSFPSTWVLMPRAAASARSSSGPPSPEFGFTIRNGAIETLLYLGAAVFKDGRSAHASVRATDDHRPMDDCGILHRIGDDLSETWIEDWAGAGVQAIVDYLAKHLAFLSFLDEASA